MRLKVPKTEKKRNPDSTFARVMRRAILWSIGLILVIMAGVHIFSLITGNQTLQKPEEAVAGVVSPIQNGFSRVVDSVAGYLRKLKLRSTLELEYNNVKQENETLTYQAMLAEELQHKLTVYENLFEEISYNESLNPLVCTVIGRESGNYFSVFTINKGANDGIKDFMAVTMEGALIGYTYNVTENKSSVRAIIDSEASIAGLISSSRDQGTVRGMLGIDGTPMCRMYYLPEDTLPRPGDLVVTSGVGMSFPKGIPIGEVRESTRGMESNKQYIVIEPQADFEHVEYVLVLRYQPEAEAIEARSNSSDAITFVPLESELPVPTVQIGSDFFQLAPSPTPSPVPSETPVVSIQPGQEATPAPSQSGGTNSYEYQVPISMQTTDNSGLATLPPTPTPTPTLPPPTYSVEAD